MAEPSVMTKQEVEQVFEGAAATYDRAGPSLFAGWGGRLVDRLAPPPGARLLDVATGRGAVLLPAARRIGPAGEAVGVDLSAAMLAQARAAADAERLAHVTLRRMDAEHLAFPDAAFDVVTCAFSLFFMSDMAAALAEMRRVCRPGGRVGVTLFSRTPPPFDPGWPLFAQQAAAYGIAMRTPQRVAHSPEEAAALLARGGFCDVETQMETGEAIFGDEGAWWAFQLTLGARAAILRMDSETRDRFKAEYLGKLRPWFRPDGLHLAVGVLYLLARV